MQYTVIWTPEAENALATIWMQASDQQAVADASNAIDRRLRTSPERLGTDLGGGQRFLQVTPLVVIFTIEPDDCRVRVLEVWREV
jgi:hypothetical protein